LRATGAMANRRLVLPRAKTRAQPVYEDSIFPGIPAHAAWSGEPFFYKPRNPALFFWARGPTSLG